MIKIFTLNKNGKIELTKEELEQLLNESYWEGYRNNNNSWIYTSPTPYKWYSNTPYTISMSSVSSSDISTGSVSSSDLITLKTNLGE